MIKRKGIEVYTREEYGNPGKIYACYFIKRNHFNNQVEMVLQRSTIPICMEEKAKKFIYNQIDLLADVWKLNPSKKRTKH